MFRKIFFLKVGTALIAQNALLLAFSLTVECRLAHKIRNLLTLIFSNCYKLEQLQVPRENYSSMACNART